MAIFSGEYRLKSIENNQSSLTLDSLSVRILFLLLRIALGKEEPSSLPNSINWQDVYDLSLRQGVGAIACDGMLALKECSIDEELRYKWMGQSMVIEQNYYQHKKALINLANFYEEKKIRMLLLKGYGLSLNYPIPEHRPAGDIDIFLFDGDTNCPVWDKGDNSIKEAYNIKVDNSHHHHTTFVFEGQSVENHYDFINVYAHKSNKRIEQALKSFAMKDYRFLDNSIIVPSDNFNALFILKHCASHFASTGIKIRNILDWLLFVEKYGCFVEWEKIYEVYRRENLDRFAAIVHAIGVKMLKFPKDLFFEVEEDLAIVNRVLEDIICPEFKEKEKGTISSSLWVKPRRWWSNRWKHDICYSDSLISSFFHSFYAKLLKPSHFIR